MKANMKRERALPDVIRKELGSDTNRRFLARMPAFRPESGMPERLSRLLGELDDIENARACSRR